MSKKYNILLTLIEPPLPFGNAAARWYYVLLRGLVDRGHIVTTFFGYRHNEDLKKTLELFPNDRYLLKPYLHSVHKGIRGKYNTLKKPFSYMFSEHFKKDLRLEMEKGFDILHLEQLWSGWLAESHEQKALVNIHHLQSIDLYESPMPSILSKEGLKTRIENQLSFSAEKRLVQKLHFFRSCSPRLVSVMKTWNESADITVVPVGLDTSLYPFISDEKRNKSPIITLIGQMGWYPSYSAAVRLLTRLWPSIKKRVPHAKLQIVGWSARTRLSKFVCQPDVEIFENVPDIQPFFDRAGVFLYAPSKGSGMKIKIMESMAYGIPVVTTSEGIEGLPAKDGIEVGLCEDDEGLIERTVALFLDVKKQNLQRRAARELIELHCSPDKTVDAIVEIYKKIKS